MQCEYWTLSYCVCFTVTRCNGGNNGGCGRKHCTQMQSGVTCSCDVYKESEENNTLARGNTLLAQ